MANTRENPQDPDSPFVTREGMRNGVSFKERFPHADPSNVSVTPARTEPISDKLPSKHKKTAA